LIERWTDLERLEDIRTPQRRRWFARWLVATDVGNPLLGPRGATRVYGPQKGVRTRDVALAERCLGRLAHLVQRQFGRDLAHEPGAGAAGGLGFGLRAFLGAELRPGFDLFARQASLGRRLHAANLVVTGEGAIDRSTVMGKGVGEIARRCRRLDIPCIGLAGVVGAGGEAASLFNQARALTELTTIRQAKAQPARWLERLAQQAACPPSDLKSSLGRLSSAA
jgi:glycerate 2-kinase